MLFLVVVRVRFVRIGQVSDWLNKLRVSMLEKDIIFHCSVAFCLRRRGRCVSATSYRISRTPRRYVYITCMYDSRLLFGLDTHDFAPSLITYSLSLTCITTDPHLSAAECLFLVVGAMFSVNTFSPYR